MDAALAAVAIFVTMLPENSRQHMQGAHGAVHLAMSNSSGALICVKRVPIPESGSSARKAIEKCAQLRISACLQRFLTKLPRTDRVTAIRTEINVLRRLSHPNIVRYLGACQVDSFLCVLMEYESGGSIADLLSRFGGDGCSGLGESVIRRCVPQHMALK